MSDDVFADIELADVWDDDPTIDPLQVARRLHLLRRQVDLLAGRDTPSWRDLLDRDRDRAEGAATFIVTAIIAREPDNPALLAQTVHGMQSPRPWTDLSPDERQIAIDLMDLIVDWLEREGPR